MIHFDDINHISDKCYLYDVMSLLSDAMIDFPLACLFSGTNTRYLSKLKESSHFNCQPIHLAPLSLPAMKIIVDSLAEKVVTPPPPHSPKRPFALSILSF